MAFCTACGGKIIPGSRFCTGCGTKVTVSDEYSPESELNFNNTNQGRTASIRRIYILAAIFIILVTAGSIIYGLQYGKHKTSERKSGRDNVSERDFSGGKLELKGLTSDADIKKDSSKNDEKKEADVYGKIDKIGETSEPNVYGKVEEIGGTSGEKTESPADSGNSDVSGTNSETFYLYNVDGVDFMIPAYYSLDEDGWFINDYEDIVMYLDVEYIGLIEGTLEENENLIDEAVKEDLDDRIGYYEIYNAFFSTLAGNVSKVYLFEFMMDDSWGNGIYEVSYNDKGEAVILFMVCDEYYYDSMIDDYLFVGNSAQDSGTNAVIF